MDHLKVLQTFLDVAKSESLSVVAREEGITAAMVGRRVDQLEDKLGVKLFKRSTRKITLTPEGTTFFEHVQGILNELHAAEEAISVGAKNASGRLIISAPTAFGRKHIAPHLPDFIKTYPNLSVTLLLSERLVDLKNERVDLAIRIADLQNADLIATKLARNHRVVVASPSFIEKFGAPTTLSELAKYNCLITATEAGLSDTWTFRDMRNVENGQQSIGIKVAGHLHCNDGEVLTRWTLAGHGLAWRSTWEVSEEIKKGRLVEVLPQYAIAGNDIYAVYADRKFLPAKVKLFIEYIKAQFGAPPYWETAAAIHPG
ncbi:MAG: LysR family transcriptional regulator, partial [Betaproteobacteria bacterium]|nr:LysR family transcriptional regulator [Betaproteobacteria bacterium]